MPVKIARADVTPKRQPSQYSCTTTSLSMALEALGFAPEEVRTDRVNAVLGAMPLHGASWEQVAGAASHYGCRSTLIIPSTLAQVRGWTDAGIPVLIGWNTGNDWSHASLIFDVDDTHVHVADPNLPNPSSLIWVGTHDDFYAKWWEKSGQGYKIRRPAMAIEREVTVDGRQVVASSTHGRPRGTDARRVAETYLMGKGMRDVKPDTRTPGVTTVKDGPRDPGRSEYGPGFVTDIMRHPGNGPHQNRDREVDTGRSRKPKHKQDWRDRESSVPNEDT